VATTPVPKTVKLEVLLSKAAKNRSLFKRLLQNPRRALAAEGLALSARDVGRLNRMRKILRRPVAVTLRRGDVALKRIRPMKNGDWDPQWPTEWRARFPEVAFAGRIKFVGPR
jgi:hypothetical protein